MNQTQALRAIPFFSGLEAEDLSAIVQVGDRVTFDPGQSMVEQGDQADAMYVVLSGAAEVDVGGRFHSLGPGAFFGEMALISSKRRMATVKAVEPVEALRIPAAGFRDFLLEHPSVSVAMLEAMVDRLREVQDRIDAWIGS
jgi:CRP-like cAMP-binding protein